MVKVWDVVVRIGHWCLVACVALAWLTHEGGGRLHEWLGYAALLVLCVRLVWGVIGSAHARFSSFMTAPRETLDYARHVFAHREQRYLGHNPLGAWMIVALITMITLTGFTGWLYTTEQFWGDKRVEEIHAWCANGLLVLIALHIGGVCFSSRRHRENLVKAMFTGMKRKD
jgi:cytochrome b